MKTQHRIFGKFLVAAVAQINWKPQNWSQRIIDFKWGFFLTGKSCQFCFVSCFFFSLKIFVRIFSKKLNELRGTVTLHLFFFCCLQHFVASWESAQCAECVRLLVCLLRTDKNLACLQLLERLLVDLVYLNYIITMF